MGKQINYWMDYRSFLLVAASAIKLGCIILKAYEGALLQTTDLSLVTSDCSHYYFHLPAAGPIEQLIYTSRNIQGYHAAGSTVIEAGFSTIRKDKTIARSRLFVISGYYSQTGEWIARPDCLTKAYHSLVRAVKKAAPCIELTDTIIKSGEQEPFIWKHKEYVSPCFIELREAGYRLTL